MKLIGRALLDFIIGLVLYLAGGLLLILLGLLMIINWMINNKVVQIFYTGWFVYQAVLVFLIGNYALAIFFIFISLLWFRMLDKTLHNESN